MQTIQSYVYGDLVNSIYSVVGLILILLQARGLEIILNGPDRRWFEYLAANIPRLGNSFLKLLQGLASIMLDHNWKSDSSAAPCRLIINLQPWTKGLEMFTNKKSYPLQKTLLRWSRCIDRQMFEWWTKVGETYEKIADATSCRKVSYSIVITSRAVN